MQKRDTISIPNAEFLERLPLYRKMFFISLLGGLWESATEIHYGVLENFGKVRVKIAGVFYECVPIGPEGYENEIIAIKNSNLGFVHFQILIGRKSTEAIGFFEEGEFVLSFPDPSGVAEEAARILQNFDKKGEK